MTRKLKGLGVAMIAVFAIAGTGASAASAAEFHFEKTGMNMTSVQSGVNFWYRLGSASATSCRKDSAKSNSFAGLSAPSAMFAPITEECVGWSGVLNWNYNGCTRKITVNTATSGTFSIECPAGKEIVISGASSKCVINVPAQTPSTPTVKLSKATSGAYQSINISIQAKGVSYTQNGFCEGAKSGSNGELFAESVARGWTDAFGLKPGNVWVE
jgi:hypothetical protein